MRLHLQIRVKGGAMIPLYPNEVQMRFYLLILSQVKQGRPVRFIILKGRQMGVSTFIQALNFTTAWQNAQVNALTTAHTKEATRELFRKQRIFLRNMPPDNLHKTEHHNRLEIVFEQPHGSQMATQTALGRYLGTSTTLTFFHGSEVAKWGEDDAEQLLSVLQTIPNLPNTYSFLESTANGIGGAFYDHWTGACLDENDPAWNSYQPLFLPWVLEPAYRLPVGPSFKRTPPEEEIVRKGAIYRAGRLIQRIEVTDEQLAWRRMTLAQTCGGDLQKFRQEYPFTPEEAFIVSGSKRFNNTILTDWLPDCVGGERLRLSDEIVRDHSRPFYDPQSPLEVWERPQPGQNYVIGADPAKGQSDGDYAAAVVLNASSRQVAALWRARMEPLFFADHLALLGRWYNDALLAPETNFDISVVSALVHDLNYPNIYLQRQQDRLGRNIIEKPGWNSNRKTKEQVITSLANHIERAEIGLRSAVILTELLGYERHEDGTLGAPEGKHNHDDTVIALAIAVFIADECPATLRSPPTQTVNLALMHPAARAIYLGRHPSLKQEPLNCAQFPPFD